MLLYQSKKNWYECSHISPGEFVTTESDAFGYVGVYWHCDVLVCVVNKLCFLTYEVLIWNIFFIKIT